MARIGRWVVVAAAAAGCVGRSTGPSGDQSAGAVAGQIVRADGSPVGGPLVGVTVTTAPVDNVAQLLGQLSVIANSEGRFTASFIVGAAPQTAEVEITVTPPIGSLLLPIDTLRIPVELDGSYPPRDTTFVQLVLPSR